MKNEGLQPILLYPARLSIEIDGEIRISLEKKKVERIHLHQTSPTRFTKKTTIRRERKGVKERGTQVQRGKNEQIPIKNDLKC